MQQGITLQMSLNHKLKVIEELNDLTNQMPAVAATTLVRPEAKSSLRIAIQLETDRVECMLKGSQGSVYMPKGSSFDLRTITNPIRRIFKKSQIEFHISTPHRHYISRKSTVNEFMGYESPEILLDIL